MFQLVKNACFVRLKLVSTLAGINSLSCISINNQECKTRPQFVNVNIDEHFFFPLSIKRVNAVVLLRILMIHMQKYVLLML